MAGAAAGQEHALIDCLTTHTAGPTGIPGLGIGVAIDLTKTEGRDCINNHACLHKVTGKLGLSLNFGVSFLGMALQVTVEVALMVSITGDKVPSCDTPDFGWSVGASSKDATPQSRFMISEHINGGTLPSARFKAEVGGQGLAPGQESNGPPKRPRLKQFLRLYEKLPPDTDCSSNPKIQELIDGMGSGDQAKAAGMCGQYVSGLCGSRLLLKNFVDRFLARLWGSKDMTEQLLQSAYLEDQDIQAMAKMDVEESKLLNGMMQQSPFLPFPPSRNPAYVMGAAFNAVYKDSFRPKVVIPGEDVNKSPSLDTLSGPFASFVTVKPYVTNMKSVNSALKARPRPSHQIVVKMKTRPSPAFKKKKAFYKTF